jgi:hypothetical protein
VQDSKDEPALSFLNRGFVSIISEPLTEEFDDIWQRNQISVLIFVRQSFAGFKNILAMRFYNSVFAFFLFCSVSVGQKTGQNWSVFRGNSDLSGNTDYEFTASPVLLWSLPTGERSKSSPVISDGVVYFGNDEGRLIAAGGDGKIKWTFKTDDPIEPPLFIPMLSQAVMTVYSGQTISQPGS